MFKDQFACAALKADKWYRFSKHRWVEDECGTSLRRAITEELHSDGFAILDLSATYDMTTHVSLQASLLNVTDEAAIVSHRPFGARPNRPQSIVGRIRYSF
jgi:outer membrane receptor protein involved in Fe transport